MLEQLTATYGEQVWEPRLDPTSELILTILTQNTADTNAEKAYEALRRAYPSGRDPEVHKPGIGWGGDGLSTRRRRTGRPSSSRRCPQLIDVIRPGGLGPQKAPRLQATLRHIREQRGDYSLAFLGDMPALEARDWLTQIDGIGKKTASIVLAFCFGSPVMAVDRHVERVSKRIGLLPPKANPDQAHDLYLGLLAARRDVRGPRPADPPRPRDLPRAEPEARPVPRARPLPLRRTPRRPDRRRAPATEAPMAQLHDALHDLLAGRLRRLAGRRLAASA